VELSLRKMDYLLEKAIKKRIYAKCGKNNGNTEGKGEAKVK
jgi:hypothetical protein